MLSIGPRFVEASGQIILIAANSRCSDRVIFVLALTRMTHQEMEA
jgi:hypothetical protein